MYAKSKNYVTYFAEEEANHTDKVIYGRVSEMIKTGENKDKYKFESWNARFVGNAREKIKNVEDKTTITLTEWSVYCPYDKEKKRPFPYIVVMDFET